MSNQEKQIIAFGGGLLLPQTNLALERYVVEATGRKRPKACFIGTASGDDAGYMARFYGTFESLDCDTTHLPLFRRTPNDIRSLLLSCNIIYVGGGNTRSMLALWREWGIDRVLREAYDEGIVLTGESAGMICWYTQAITDSLADALTPIACLGLLPGSAAPHYDKETERRPQFRGMIAAKIIADGVAADNGVGLHYVNGELSRVVTVDAAATGYRVRLTSDDVEEERLDATVLERVLG